MDDQRQSAVQSWWRDDTARVVVRECGGRQRPGGDALTARGQISERDLGDIADPDVMLFVMNTFEAICHRPLLCAVIYMKPRHPSDWRHFE